MADRIHVELARIPDRERLLEALAERGVEARATDTDGRLGVEIPCDDGDPERPCADVAGELEGWLDEIGLQLVPMETDDGLFLRPPAD